VVTPLGFRSVSCLLRGAFHIGSGLRVVDHAHHRDDVERTIELPVTAVAKALPNRLSGGSRDRIDPGDRCEGTFIPNASGVGPDHQCFGRSHWADPGPVEEACSGTGGHELSQVSMAISEVGIGGVDSLGQTDRLRASYGR
jgi:hypothetical protein